MNRRTLLITGAASGIGRAVAARYAQRGWFVGLADRDREGLDAARASLPPDHVQAFPMDVTNRDAVEESLRAFADATGGRLDALVQSAGVMTVGRFADVDLDAHHRHLDVNLGGVITVAHAAFPLLRDTPGARMISLASASGLYGTPEIASYSATKAAVRSLTQSLNLEWASHDIHVCDIVPPYVDSPLTQNAAQSTSMERLGIHLTPDDVADVIDAAMQDERIHWPVGSQMQWLYRAASVLPDNVVRLIMRYVSGF